MMSFSGNHVPTSFLVELLSGTHDFTADTFKLALYDENATLNADTTAYSATNEVSGSGYTAGGATLTPSAPASDGRTALVDFSDLTFSAVTVTARGGLIYNSSKSNRAVSVLDFGRNIIKTAADLVVTMPTPDRLNALVRLQG
jgi:hypothetical protein